MLRVVFFSGCTMGFPIAMAVDDAIEGEALVCLISAFFGRPGRKKAPSATSLTAPNPIRMPKQICSKPDHTRVQTNPHIHMGPAVDDTHSTYQRKS